MVLRYLIRLRSFLYNMSTWNYRILRHNYGAEVGYEIHEVYYDDDGNPQGWTENGKAPYGETPEDLIWCLETMLADARKSVADIIDYDTNPTGKGL